MGFNSAFKGLRQCEYDVHFLDLFAKLRKATIRFVMSVGPNRTNRLTLDGFS